MSESKLNIELFKKVREKIATTPEAYDQSVFGRPEPDAPCGTAGCIAGWAMVLSATLSAEEIQLANVAADSNNVMIDLVRDRATEVLGLSDAEADTLFQADPGGEWDDYDETGNDVYVESWPEPFAEQWRKGSSDRDQIAIAYLDHIIETGKVLE